MGVSINTLLLRRCAQTIEEIIVPNVSTAFAGEQAVAVATILKILAPNIEEKVQPVRQENDEIRVVLGRILERLDKGRPSSSGLLRNKLRDLLGRQNDQSDASVENSDLKYALVETMKGLDALEEELSVETVSYFNKEIHSVIRCLLDRQMVRVTGSQWRGADFLAAEKST